MSLKSILLVEDDRSINSTICETLNVEGYAVFVAHNGREALNQLKILEPTNHPCMIVLDMLMPVMDGWEFLKAVSAHETWWSIPILVITAGHKQTCPQDVPCLLKPFDVNVFLNKVKELCGDPAVPRKRRTPQVKSG